jgi:GT2 family glycosyltransferase
MKLKITAVVVTYNRKDLLAECLAALEAQVRPPDNVFVIDNASTDGTEEFFATYAPTHFTLRYERLKTNVGGAGGFNYGIALAYQDGCDWVWVMDDDTIATSTALSALLDGLDFAGSKQISPLIMASRVNWTDGTPHPMNMPRVFGNDWDMTYACLEKQMLPIRSTSFVSMLLSTQAVKQFGLPIADYFIWSDDVEYSARVLRDNIGFVVSTSVVEHKTKTKHTPLDIYSGRLYFAVRNALWLLKSPAWNRKERLLLLVSNISSWGEYLKQGRFSWAIIKNLSKPIFDGIFKSPRLES